MKKYLQYLLVFMSMWTSVVLHAHDADKAYFQIEETQDNIIVRAQFPWSIRKVLDNIKSENKQSLNDKLFSYLKENILIENNDGDLLSMEEVVFVKESSENHHSTINYRILFEGSKLYKLSNTVMCDYFKNQMNYHTISNREDIHVTSNKNPYFIIENTSFPLPRINYLIPIIGLLILGCIVYMTINWKTTS